jgi:type IV secretory pathway VirD2 relaxase
MAGLFDFEKGFEPLLRAPSKPKKSHLKDIKLAPGKSRARRIVAGAPEVLVKVTGHARGAKHLRRLMQYISRDGELIAENDLGEALSGKEAVAGLANDWNAELGKRKQSTRDTVNIVLSMPASTDPQSVLNAARQLAASEFAQNHEYVMVLHTFETDPSPTPSPNPHVHLVVKSLGFDGRRLNPRKADLQRWRDVFAERLREQGIDCESTPRRARGVVKKSARRPLHHAEKRDPRTARTESTVKEQASELIGKTVAAERPWEAAIRTRQAMVRSTWLEAAKSLEGSPEVADKQLSAQIRAFVAKMPAVTTRREEIAEQLREQIAERLPPRHPDRGPER